MKSRGDEEMVRAFKKSAEIIITREFKPRSHMPDNEASTSSKQKIQAWDITYQLLPPSNHRSNNEEQDHIVAGFFSV